MFCSVASPANDDEGHALDAFPDNEFANTHHLPLSTGLVATFVT